MMRTLFSFVTMMLLFAVNVNAQSAAEILSNSLSRGSADAMQIMRLRATQDMELARLNAEQMQRAVEMQFQRERVQLEMIERLQQMALQVSRSSGTRSRYSS